MKVNDILQNEETVLRVLAIKDDNILCINCSCETMPIWIPESNLRSYIPGTFPVLDINMTAKQNRIAHERYTLIAPVLAFLTDDKERSRLLNLISKEHGISKQTLRRYLCRYLVYQDFPALAPVTHEANSSLTQDQKNMRWALNKYFYTPKKCKLTEVYVKLLKE